MNTYIKFVIKSKQKEDTQDTHHSLDFVIPIKAAFVKETQKHIPKIPINTKTQNNFTIKNLILQSNYINPKGTVATMAHSKPRTIL